MPKPRPPHLQHEITRHGKTVWYVRRRGVSGKRVRILAPFGTDEFMAEYHTALAGLEKPVTKARSQSGTLLWLYERYQDSSAWRDLSLATQRQRMNILAKVMETAGKDPYVWLDTEAIEEGKDRRRDTPAQARNFLDAMRGLLRWAKEAGHLKADPTAGVKNPKRKKTEGFKAWASEDVALFEAHWPLGTRQHVWLNVLLYIGCRRGDAVMLGKQHVRHGVITFITEKGRDRERIEVSRRIEPELARVLETGPCGDLAFICGERGHPLTKETFGNEFKEACRSAGILDKSAHGLRKLSATIWAERGATEHELMAMFGWLTPQMAALYTRAARRKMLSLNATDRLTRNDRRTVYSRT